MYLLQKCLANKSSPVEQFIKVYLIYDCQMVHFQGKRRPYTTHFLG